MSATNCFIKLFFWTGGATPCILRSSIKMEHGIRGSQKNGPQTVAGLSSAGVPLPHASSHSPCLQWRRWHPVPDSSISWPFWFALSWWEQLTRGCFCLFFSTFQTLHPIAPELLTSTGVTWLSGWLFWWQAGFPQPPHSLRFQCKNSVILYGFLH